MRRLALPLLALGLSALHAEELHPTDAVRAALASHPRLEAARARRESASAQARQAQWDQLGRLDLGLQWNPSYQNREVTLPSVPPTSFSLGPYARHQIEASLTQPLWTWGALTGRSQAASFREEAGLQAESREAQMVAFEATRAFLFARQAQESVLVAEQSVAQQQAFLLTARARVAEGAAPRLDVLKAELSLSEAESKRITARNEERSTREELVTVTGQARFRSATLRSGDTPLQDLPSEDAALTRALSQRADLKGAARLAQALRTGAAAERAAGLPSLSLRTVLSQSSDAASGLHQSANRTYALGLAVQWEAFASKRSQLRFADLSAQARTQEAQTRNLEDQLKLEIRTARWKVENARAQEGVAQRALAQAEEQARVSRVAYQEGIRTAVERQLDEVALSGAQDRLLQAQTDLELAWAALRLALGD
ncbi:TolC family protein [Geothrix sp. PMB-07]|uniref:TolC family protein n=1 Tax=Geothrix sp. PMB-07 TaxID=3068640 RepID=UPI002742477E|nr:TolC family protein [Geothrix sp. PMB-07]WLT30986.1 TolC family protein [Geothrix sp. PMB-07]